MVTSLGIFISFVSLVIALAAAVGGWSAFRSNRADKNATIQSQTIDALSKRIDTLESERESDKQELSRLRQIISTIRQALKRRGLHIEIDGEFVTIVDSAGGQETAGPRTRIKPVKLVQPNGEDDAS
jgi:Flp pilus assembly protein TadB